MPKGPAARVMDPVLHPLPGMLQPGPGSMNVIIGGMLAWWLTEVMVIWSEGVVKELAGLYNSNFRLVGMGAFDGFNLILLGALLGLIASWFSVHRHIRDIEPS